MIKNLCKSVLVCGVVIFFSPPLLAEWCQKGQETPVKCKNGRWCDTIPTQYCRKKRGCPCYKAKRPKKCGAQCLQDWDCLGAGKGNCTRCIEQACSCPCKAKSLPCRPSNSAPSSDTLSMPSRTIEKSTSRIEKPLEQQLMRQVREFDNLR